MTRSQAYNAIKEHFGKYTNIDFTDHITKKQFATIESADEMDRILEEADAFNVEIIYYTQAMEYLAENDRSLRSSLSIAEEMGLELSGINSETLASLLASENARKDFAEINEDIDEIINQIK